MLGIVFFLGSVDRPDTTRVPVRDQSNAVKFVKSAPIYGLS